MQKRAPRRHKRQPLLPPLNVPFEEAVTRLLQVKPPARAVRKMRSSAGKKTGRT